MRTIQIITDDFEGLFNFDSIVVDKEIKFFYRGFEQSDYSDFEEYMNEVHPSIVCERIYI